MSQNNGKRKRRMLWIIAIAGAVLVCVGGCCIASVFAPDQAGDSGAATVATWTPLPTYTPIEEVASRARLTFGGSLRDVKTGDVDGETIVTVDYDLGAVWDEAGAVQTALRDVERFAPAVFEVDGAADVLEMRAVMTFENAYGNESEEVAFKFTITAEAAEKVNWDNVDDIGAVLEMEDGCGVYVHPALAGAWEWR